MQHLDIESIQRSPWWPVRHRPKPSAEEIARAAESFLVTPVVVRRVHDADSGRAAYEIIDNELCWAIAQEAGIFQVPAIIMDVSRDEARALVESRYRALYPQCDAPSSDDTTAALPEEGPMAVAAKYRDALQDLASNPKTHSRKRGRKQTLAIIARKFRTSSASVRQYLNLLDLEPRVQREVSLGSLPFGTARLMNKLSPARQDDLLRLVKTSGYSVRDAEEWIRQQKTGTKGREIIRPNDPDIRRFERQLTERVGSVIEIKPDKNGGGRLVIHYHNSDHLEGILSRPIQTEFD